MGKIRDMRLLEDKRKIVKIIKQYPFLGIISYKGNPPTEYVLKFRLDGYVNQLGKIADKHIVRLSLPEQYPISAPPKFSFLGGLYHPNVYRNGDVCHGWYLNNWNPAIHIDDLITDIAKMICFKEDSYNLKSPANYACDADWIKSHQIPVDDTDLSVDDTNEKVQTTRPFININNLSKSVTASFSKPTYPKPIYQQTPYTPKKLSNTSTNKQKKSLDSKEKIKVVIKKTRR